MSLRLLDLYCGAGGAAVGYSQAGIEVVAGVDREPQPRYPFPLYREDVSALSVERFCAFVRFHRIDVIHASPPCQFGTALRHAPGAKDNHVNLIPYTRKLLEAAGLPYVIENVESNLVKSHMPGAIVLCGSMFGLGVGQEKGRPWYPKQPWHQLRRHRLFQANWPLAPPWACAHADPVIGIYGGHARRRAAGAGGRRTRDVWVGGHVAAARAALNIDWMTLNEMSQAVPPAYTRWIGECLIQRVREAGL